MKLDTKFKFANFYNKPETVVLVASFPGRHDRSIRDIDAVASYTDHLTSSLRQELALSNRKLVILTQKIDGVEEWYEEKGVLICRVWGKGSLLCYAQILAALSFFKQSLQILVQFEFHQFGGNTQTAMFPLFLIALKLFKKQTMLVLHQVVSDIGTLSGHLNIAPRGIRHLFFDQALRIFYQLASRLPEKLIVHNRFLAKRLERSTGRLPIVIPHGLGAIKGHESHRKAKKLLGYKPTDRVIMTFGFLAWYKGTDWLVKTFSQKKDKRLRLLVAGGPSPNLADRPHYQKYVKGIEALAGRDQRIKITGFVENAYIPLYFAAADLIVLPYRTLISSSGPLAMTMAFEKPFIMSNAIKPYLYDTDFGEALSVAGLKPSQLTFPLQPRDFWRKVARAFSERRNHARVSKLVRRQRLWKEVSKRFVAALDQSALADRGIFAIMHREGTFSYAGQS